MREPLPETTEVRDRLRAIVAPLVEQREQIVQEIAKLTAQVAALRQDLADIDAVLKRLDPTTLPQTPRVQKIARKASSRAAVALEEKRAAVVDYLNGNPPEIADGFTMNELIPRMRDRGTPVSANTLHPIFEDLRDSGVIRLDRKTKGGGNLYMLVDNGASHA